VEAAGVGDIDGNLRCARDYRQSQVEVQANFAARTTAIDFGQAAAAQ
jgi:hypothetical protein